MPCAAIFVRVIEYGPLSKCKEGNCLELTNLKFKSKVVKLKFIKCNMKKDKNDMKSAVTQSFY